MGDSFTVHRKGKLSQKNKPFKGQRKATKGAIKRTNKGRILSAAKKSSTTQSSLKHGAAVARMEKEKMMHRQQELRKKKRMEVMQGKRLGTAHGAPKIVGFVSLREDSEGNNGVDFVRKVLTKSAVSDVGDGSMATGRAAMDDDVDMTAPAVGDHENSSNSMPETIM